MTKKTGFLEDTDLEGHSKSPAQEGSEEEGDAFLPSDDSEEGDAFLQGEGSEEGDDLLPSNGSEEGGAFLQGEDSEDFEEATSFEALAWGEEDGQEEDAHAPQTLRLSWGDHPISEEVLPPEAIWIMERLRWAGYCAYLVGGSVRDILLGLRPKDFDLVTDARPEEVRRLFLNSRLIGRRFTVVHVYFRGGKTYDVATFRARPVVKTPPSPPTGPLLRDNQFGTPEEDAWRRDITINGLFYDSEKGEVIDHVGGLADLRDGVIRLIGDPMIRLREDPVRMLRAIRHAARLGFSIEEHSWAAIKRLAPHIKMAASDRLYEEFMREIRGGSAFSSLSLMMGSGLLKSFMPTLERWLARTSAKPERSLPFVPFGEYASPTWAEDSSFWRRLAALDEETRLGADLSDFLRLLFLFLPPLWAGILFPQPDLQTKPGLLWKVACAERLEPIFKELRLYRREKEIIYRLLEGYWKLHKTPSSGSLPPRLTKSVFFPPLQRLFALEARTHNVPLPAWHPSA